MMTSRDRSARELLLVLDGLGPHQFLRLFELSFPRGRQTLARAVDEILYHADAGADAIGTDFLARHHLGDRRGVFGESTLRWKSRNRLHLLDPFFPGGHGCVLVIGDLWMTFER